MGLERFWGVDISLNHAAFVELDVNGKMKWFRYIIDTAKNAVATHGGIHMPIKKPKGGDPDAFQMARLLWWKSTINALLVERTIEAVPALASYTLHVAVEDYAPMTEGNAEYKGELGSIVRLEVLEAGAKLRLHEPMTVKMFVAHNGGATPEDVADAAQERWPESELFRVLPLGGSGAGQLDCFTAYGLAQMCLIEWRLRKGKISLESLHDKERQAFARVTKRQPVNLLGRDWLSKEPD